MDKFEHVMVSAAAVFIALLMLLTMNIVVYGAEANDGLDSFGGVFDTVKEIKDGKPQWLHRNIYVSETQQKFQIVCVYQQRGVYTMVYPVVFAVDGSKLDARLSVKMKTDEQTAYTTLVDEQLADSFKVSARWKTSTSGKLVGTYIGIYSNAHMSSGDMYKLVSSMPLLKYDDTLGNADYGNTVTYAMDTYEQGWENNPNYTPPARTDNNSEKDETLGYLTDVTHYEVTSNEYENQNRRLTSARTTWNTVKSSSGFEYAGKKVSVEIQANYSMYVYDSFGKKLTDIVNEGKYVNYDTVAVTDGKFEFNAAQLFMPGNPLYEQVQEVQKENSVLKTTKHFVNVKLRILYMYENGKYKYGPWLEKSYNGSKYINKDEDGNETDTPDGGKVDKIPGTSNEVIMPTNPYEKANLSWFLEQLQSLKTALGQFPQLVSEVFGWLPSSVITLIGVGIAIMIVIALIRAVRG